MLTFTELHVLLSLVGVLTGLIVLFGLCTSNAMPGWSLVFFATTLATNLTGCLFPFKGLTPAIGLGILSTPIVITAVTARYQHLLQGNWRWIYVLGVMLALYLNTVVLVVQSFLKATTLHALAPTGTEAPFVITQCVVLALFVGTGLVAVKKFHPKAL